MGKSYQKTSEVQEMIDICDFAVDFQSNICLTIASERPDIRMYEQCMHWIEEYFSL